MMTDGMAYFNLGTNLLKYSVAILARWAIS
jgi:hypothetical protein